MASAEEARISQLAPFTVTDRGERPHIAVDAEGSAHVAWNEVVDGAADVLHYCRIPRGQRACAVQQQFVPPETEPSLNKEFGGPQIVLWGGDRIALLTHRYPNVVRVDDQGTVSPDCTTCHGEADKTYAYYSVDNGNTFGAADVFSHARISGEAISFSADVPAPAGQPGTNRATLIGTISDTESGATYFTSAPPFGYARTSANLGDGGPDRAYGGTLAADNDVTPVAAFADLQPRIYLRRYSGQGRPNDVASWAPAVEVARGSEPQLAGGPGGVHLSYKPATPGEPQFRVHRVSGTSLGDASTVSDGGVVANQDTFADDGGTLHAAWVRRDGAAASLRYRFAPDGATFSPVRELARRGDGSIWNVDLGAAEDGGGFAVFSSTLSGNGQVTVVPFGSQERRRLIDVRISAIEVTQAVQKPTVPTRPNRSGAVNNDVDYDGVPLGAYNTTVVRVYARARRGLDAGQRTTMTLRIFRDGQEQPGPLLPEAVGTIPESATDAISTADRSATTTAWTFTIPWQSANGTITLQAEINPAGLEPSLPECRQCRADNVLRLRKVTFQRTTRVTIVPISLIINGARPRGFPDASVPFGGVRAVTPVPVDVPAYRTEIDVSDIVNDTDETLAEKTSLTRERVEDWADDNADRSGLFPVGVFPGGRLTAGGNSSGGATNADGRLYGDEQAVAIVADDRPLTSVAHEIHHGLDRVHAGQTCGSNSNGQVGEPWAPNNDGAIGGEVGLDQRPGSPFQPLVAGQPNQPPTYFDFMSYCANNNESTAGGNVPNAWISTLNWIRAISYFPPAASSTNARRAGASSANNRRAGVGQVRRIAAARPAQAKSLRVVSMVAAGAPPSIVRVAPDDGPATPVDPANGLELVGRDRDGKELRRAGAVVQPVHQDEQGQAAIVSGRIEAAGLAAIDLFANGQPIAQRTASRNAPRVRVLAPRRGARVGGRGKVEVRWRATDADKDPLITHVEYSANGGRSFRTVQVGPSRGRALVPAGLLTRARRARIRVRAQDGFHETVALSKPFRSSGAPATVRVTVPPPGTRLIAGAALSLAGEAYGAEGRRLTGRALTWRTGRRVLGRGARITVPSLAPGKRRISLTAKPRNGRPGTASVSVRVAPDLPRFTVLQAPTRVRSRARRVNIRAATTFPATLQVGKRRLAVGPRARRIGIPVRPGRSLLSLTLRLRSGRLTTAVPILIPRS